MHLPLLIAGDFNVILCAALDSNLLMQVTSRMSRTYIYWRLAEILALHFLLNCRKKYSWAKRAEFIFEQGNNNGKLLAILVAEQRLQTNIHCIKNTQGVILVDPTDILDKFVEYYKAFYAPIPAYSAQEALETLSSLNIPVLSETDRYGLEAEITKKD